MRRAGNALFFLALFLLVAAAPLPLASVNTWWSMPLAGAALLLGTIGLLAPPPGARPPRLGLAAFGGFALLAFLQIAPLPDGVRGLLGPGAAGVPPPPDGAPARTLSAAPGATLEQALLFLSLLYLVGATAVRRADRTLLVLAAAGALHAGLALFLLAGGGTTETRVLYVYTLPEVLTPFGSWVNKNHFAGFMIIGAGACTALALKAAHDAADGGAPELRALVTSLGGGAAWRMLGFGLGALLCAFALFASGSRGAALALLGAAVGVPLLAGIARGRVPPWPVGLVLIAIVGAALAAQFVGSTSVLERLVPEGRYMNRPLLWRDSARMALDHPVAGTGLGSFPYAFPRYQTFDPDRQFSHAEGDWVQVMAESGAIGLLLLALFAAALFRSLSAAFRSEGPARPLAIGAGAGLAGIGLHGFLDSSLHIPANLLAGTVLAGAVLALRNSSGAGAAAAAESAAEEGREAGR